ncbi:SAYSvFN domain-containing protein 1 [Clupea harengus]|uniref:SAYSvFN domain-containing protein 1 n=1 Tax=Clupea harengus TaxID=7950 RepID=A0A6P3VFZ1_CLUHA|nr:SAYSvFN domain-containing protein 1 [Clupea harengus]
MEKMEQRLAEFRARKKAEATNNRYKQNEQTPTVSSEKQAVSESTTNEKTEEKQLPPTVNTSSVPATTAGHSRLDLDWWMESALGRWLGVERLAITNLTVLKVLLWLVLLGLFSELDFGLPFFLISLFYWLYEGLRAPTERRQGELSAYSVFNPDCQPLLGALTAEQLEGEMGYRPLANR